MHIATFNIRRSSINNVHHIEVSGDLDNDTYAKLEGIFKEILSDSGAHKVLLDFTNVHGFCSAAEFVLIWAQNQLKQKNGQLALYCGNRDVWELMHAFGLDSYLNLFADKNQAINHLNS